MSAFEKCKIKKLVRCVSSGKKSWLNFSERAVLVTARSEKFWLKSEKKSIIERTRLFLCNRFLCAENRQSGPSRFFSGSGWNLWIFMSRACCAWRTSSLLRRWQQTQHVQQLHLYIRHRHLRPLFSSAKQNIRSVTSVLQYCQSRNTWPRLMNINFQSRFSAQWNTPKVTGLEHVASPCLIPRE